MKRTFYLLLIFCCYTELLAQNPSFSPFEGNIYVLPNKELEMGHGPHIYDDSIIGQVRFEELNFESRNFNLGLPGVPIKDAFGLVLFSTLSIEQDGCYLFALNSDDGSKLWIDQHLLLNNDRPHKMRLKIDTLWLKRGKYPVKLWYYNAYPERLGLELKSKMLPDSLTCHSTEQLRSVSEHIQGDILFDFDDISIKKEAYSYLDSLVFIYGQERFDSVHIIGHTDSIGSEFYNQQLSLRRAHAIRTYLMEKYVNLPWKIKISGAGERQPVKNNTSKENRSQNRRVEIIFSKTK